MHDINVQVKEGKTEVKIDAPALFISMPSEPVQVQTADGDQIEIGIQQTIIQINAGCGCADTGGGTGAAGATFTGTAGEDIAALDLVYIASDGLIYRADANDEAKETEGIAPAAIANGASSTVNLGQCSMTGFVGLTSGRRYFLSADTPGAITDAIPAFTTTGGIVQQVGKALSATRFYFDPKISVYDGGTGAVGDYFITEGGDSFITEGGDALTLE